MEKTIKINDYTLDRTVYLTTEINPTSVLSVQDDILSIIRKDKETFKNNIENISQLGEEITNTYINKNSFLPIKLIINSPGGSVYSGLGLYDFIYNISHNTEYTIDVEIVGMAASMATIIMLAADKRISTKNSSFLVHSMSTLNYGKIQDLKDNVKECERLNKIVHDIYLNRTKITEELLEKIDKEKIEYWINAEEALNLGLITEIV